MRRRLWLRWYPVHINSSFLRRTVRWKLMPHAGALGSKASVRKGMSISITQPISLWRTRAFQMPSHSRLFDPPGPIRASAIRPAGFISKK